MKLFGCTSPPLTNTLFLILLLLLFLPYYATGQDQRESFTTTEKYTQTLYVAVNTTQCPQNISQPCRPLSYYMNDVHKYFTNNTNMIFYGGTHITSGDSIEIKNVTNFVMIGLGEFTESQYTSQSENITLWESSSIIKCQNNRSGINFTWVRDITIKNLTFTGCYGLSHRYKGSFTFDTAWDVTLDNVTVRNNIGFGLHGYQMYGNTKISNCVFYNNSGNMYTTGGNSQFFYDYCLNNHSAHVNITHSYFLNGYSPYTDYGAPMATGITITVGCPNITFSISHVKTINNHAKLGGNIAVVFFANPGQMVTIENSHIMGGSAYYGGGLKIWTLLPMHGMGKPNILVKNVHFIDNKAWAGGGALYITAYQKKFIKIIAPIYIQNCTFINNSAGSGAAVKIIKHQMPRYMKHTSLQFHMVFNSCTFSWNYPNVVNNMHIQAAIVEVYAAERITFENCNFTDNNATALSLVSSNVCFYGKLRFERNRGVNGGALKFCQSSAMYISNHTQVLFINNSAQYSGGAIYSEGQCSVSSSPCFFQVLVPNVTYEVYLEYLKLTLKFANNIASYAGDVIYGGAIDDCYTYTPVCTAHDCSVYFSDGLFKSIFKFKDQPENYRISSNPLGVCFCDHNMSFDCSNKSYILSHAIYPGQEFNVPAVVVGQLNGTRPGIVQSNITHGGGNIIKGEVTILNNRTCHNITLAIGNVTSQAIISFLVKLSDPTTEAFYYQYKTPNVTVTLKPCPWGFSFTQDETGIASCQCDPLLTQHGVKCYINNQTILRESPTWIGMFKMHTGNCQNTSGTDSTCTGVVVKTQCPFDYCRTEPVYLTESNLDDQCANNRAGTLCGKCHEGYSVVTGSSHCKKCGNKYLFLIPLYLIAGVLLVGCLMLFNLTVSTGTFNGLVFYANFVQFNHNIYFPPKQMPGYYTVASLFISWLNLETGLAVCFYDSMDAYVRSWLKFTFPIYIWVIAGLIIFLSRKFNLVTRLVGRNAVKILATLIFLSYAQLLCVAIEIFQFTFIKQGEKDALVWLPDANVEYWEAKRIPLFVVSFLFAIASLVYAVILTFITCLYRVSDRRACFWVGKLKPFFDAYTGPYKVKYGFWPGVMFLFRIIFFTAFALNVLGEPDLNMFLTAMMCLIILIIAWLLGGVYQNKWVDVLEAISIFNLAVISISTLLISKHSSTSGPQQAVIYTSIYASMLLFVFILCYHNNQRMNRGLHNMINWLQRRRMEQNQSLLQQQPHGSIQSREGLLECEDN